MRSAALVPLLAVIAVPPAAAQVTVNLRALQGLPTAPHHHRFVHRKAAGHRAVAVRQSLPLPPEPPQPAVAAAAATPVMPAAPPAAPSAPTLTALPAAAPAPAAAALAAPPPPPIPAPASGHRTLDVSFAPDAGALSPAETAAVTALAHSVRRTPETSFDVAAHAPAAGTDASTARRLSLDRALAVRAALIAGGVPGGSVYMRALGAPPPSEAAEANRARITVMGIASSPAPQQAKP